MLASLAKWAIVLLIAFGTLVRVALVGKPREPITGWGAVVDTIVNTLIIIAILTYWQT